jgi:ABC-2 type transport system ATP-binding protein
MSSLQGPSPQPSPRERGEGVSGNGNGRPLVSVRNLTRRFGSFVAVNDVSFDIPRGKIFGFLGPNGSGKSTTIRMLAGLLEPTSGSITGLGGLDATKQTEQWKHRLGYMSQKFSLYTDLTVIENLHFFGAVYGLSNSVLEQRIAELSARLKFEKTLRVLTGGLSTGLRQRVALAAALLHEPELLFLDEPTGGVDPRGRRMFWDLIYELAADRGMTVLVTTHYMDEAEQCDRLVMILNGKIIADGTPREIKAGLSGRLIEVRPSKDPFVAMSEAQHHASIEDAYLYGVTLRVVSAPNQVTQASSALAPLGEVTSAEPSLEDAFVALVRQRQDDENREKPR